MLQHGRCHRGNIGQSKSSPGKPRRQEDPGFSGHSCSFLYLILKGAKWSPLWWLHWSNPLALAGTWGSPPLPPNTATLLPAHKPWKDDLTPSVNPHRRRLRWHRRDPDFSVTRVLRCQGEQAHRVEAIWGYRHKKAIYTPRREASGETDLPAT